MRTRLTADVEGNRSSITCPVTLKFSLLAVGYSVAPALAQTPHPGADDSTRALVQQLLGRDVHEAAAKRGE